jgi:hypothetical protein
MRHQKTPEVDNGYQRKPHCFSREQSTGDDLRKIAGDFASIETEETGFGLVGIIVTTDTTGKLGSDDRRKYGGFFRKPENKSYAPKPKGTLPCYSTTYSLSTPANV